MIYIDGTPTSDDTLPMVLWENQMSQGTLTASSSAADGPYTNAVTETTYDYWKPTSLPANLRVDKTSGFSTSMLAIVGHNLGSTASRIKLQYAYTTTTNLLLWSEGFDNAAWVKGNVTVTADSAIAPDGTLTADKLIANTSVAQHYLSQTFTTTIGQKYLLSVYLKAAENTVANISYGSGFPSVNLSTGAITSGPVGAYSQDIGNGWWRFVFPYTATATSIIYYIWPKDLLTAAGDGTSGIYAWGAQAEANSGSVAGAYVKTTTTSTSTFWQDATNWIAPTDDTTLLVKHSISTTSAYWRIVVSGVTIPYIGICILGTPLILPGGVRPGYTPIWQAQKVELLQSKSLGGQFLGNRILRQGAETSIGLVSFSRSFAEADLQPFKAWYNGGHAFIWASGPSIFTKDVGYCWRKPNAEMRPTFTETGNWVDVTMEVEAYVQ